MPKDTTKLPCFVKPHNQGSSIGASIVRNKTELARAIKIARRYSDKILIEEYLVGKELTCAVLGNEEAIALPVIEIVPKKGEFFDYESKYTESGSDEIVPARIPKRLTKVVQELSIKVHKAIGAKGFSRVDFILKENKYPVILEINTIPGLTPMSLFPKAARAYGLSYSELLDDILRLGGE
ncbi:MAG: ATP-grasp domain-containing protein [Candidatus Woesebacteria bacterium]|nr:ATP-grasp domain-containing protein [Candidatus Woesebacteria bacterium]